jgi:hypothetical protein
MEQSKPATHLDPELISLIALGSHDLVAALLGRPDDALLPYYLKTVDRPATRPDKPPTA